MAVLVVWIHRTLCHLVYGVRLEYIYRAFDTRMDHLAVGCLLAVLLKIGSLDGFARWVTRHSWYPVITLLLLFGGKKIPELMRGLGKGMKEFKDAQKGDAPSDEKR